MIYTVANCTLRLRLYVYYDRHIHSSQAVALFIRTCRLDVETLEGAIVPPLPHLLAHHLVCVEKFTGHYLT